ncbi:stalk domain-containing protein [Brevibacillus laterosporus]|uniref:stalk domain-containing protein n=1 Tax=Brevibacillus laterosporus TaxID=1465 RepID=UPI000CE2FAF7|nr:stalk domain-containing protein [Brevibacillus laterosporus]MED1666790.1 stalk domain-containing protein [Brevibacillus laterosporus]MED1670688.1 stalk domain-containing protein [Brevibacillus laterosporus]MED1720380.1 stalk domain-containing protein [Brevibacillus laterosporus]PPA83153.1 copper amine oxidase [Brevibacillus laterosporus]
MLRKTTVVAVMGLALVVSAIPGMAQVTVKPVATSLMINQQKVIKHSPLISVNQRTMISLQELSKLTGGQLTEKAGAYELKVKEKSLVFQTGKSSVLVNGKEQKVEEGAVVYQGKVYVPLRWTMESLSAQVKWDGKTDEIQVTNLPVVQGEQPASAFQTLTEEQLSVEEKAFVESVKGERGVHQQGDLYVIAYGEAPNPGYGLVIDHTEQSWEMLKVYVKQTKPDANKMYPMVISYPYVVGKISTPPYTTVTFCDVDTGKLLFEGEKSTPQKGK